MNSTDTTQNAFKDLGVVLSPEIKHRDQGDTAVKIAKTATFLIRWVYRHPRKCS